MRERERARERDRNRTSCTTDVDKGDENLIIFPPPRVTEKQRSNPRTEPETEKHTTEGLIDHYPLHRGQFIHLVSRWQCVVASHHSKKEV